MLEEVEKISPLQGVESPTGGVTLREAPFLGKINLRGDPTDKIFKKAVAGVLGCSLPSNPNTVIRHGNFTIFWLGPDEWLIHTPQDQEGSVIDSLKVAVVGIHAAVTDVSDYYVVIEIRGGLAEDVLVRGCPLDLHFRFFPENGCAQTIFSHASILLYRANGGYDVQVRWTYAQYLWRYLVEATESIAVK